MTRSALDVVNDAANERPLLLARRREAALKTAADNFQTAKRDAGPAIERLAGILEKILEQNQKILDAVAGPSGKTQFTVTARGADGKVKSFEVKT
jgi:hypothetical protein